MAAAQFNLDFVNSFNTELKDITLQVASLETQVLATKTNYVVPCPDPTLTGDAECTRCE